MKTAKTLISCLARKGKTQVELAKVAGVSQMTISRWSRDADAPVTVAAYSKLLNLWERIKDQK